MACNVLAHRGALAEAKSVCLTRLEALQCDSPIWFLACILAYLRQLKLLSGKKKASFAVPLTIRSFCSIVYMFARFHFKFRSNMCDYFIVSNSNMTPKVFPLFNPDLHHLSPDTNVKGLPIYHFVLNYESGSKRDFIKLLPRPVRCN